jgi:hypothetical protein
VSAPQRDCCVDWEMLESDIYTASKWWIDSTIAAQYS